MNVCELETAKNICFCDVCSFASNKILALLIIVGRDILRQRERGREREIGLLRQNNSIAGEKYLKNY
jgi:hypothetical protein